MYGIILSFLFDMYIIVVFKGEGDRVGCKKIQKNNWLKIF